MVGPRIKAVDETRRAGAGFQPIQPVVVSTRELGYKDFCHDMIESNP